VHLFLSVLTARLPRQSINIARNRWLFYFYFFADARAVGNPVPRTSINKNIPGWNAYFAFSEPPTTTDCTFAKLTLLCSAHHRGTDRLHERPLLMVVLPLCSGLVR
jgi:hypothetical protein